MTDTSERPPTPEDWARLGKRVGARLRQIGLEPGDVEAAKGPKPTKLREITSGRSRVISPRLKSNLENALFWRPGSIDSVLAGGEPEVIRVTHIDVADLRRRFAIEAKPAAERTREESEFLRHVADRIHHHRPDPNIGVDESGEFRTPELVFEDWQLARARVLNLTLEYAHARKISFQAAEEELPHVLQMASDVQLGTGRPWTPPWNPGPEFREGESPWKREWWAIIEQSLNGVNRIGTSWDIEEVRRNRKGDEQRKREWEAHREAELRKYYRDQGAEIPPPFATLIKNLDAMFERLSAIDPVLDSRPDLRQLVQAIKPTMDTPAGVVVFIEAIERLLTRAQENLRNYQTDPDLMREIGAMQREVEQYVNLTPVGGSPSQSQTLATAPGRRGAAPVAALTAPPGHRIGQSEQGDAGGEETQDIE